MKQQGQALPPDISHSQLALVLLPACGVTPIGQSQMTSTLAKETSAVGEFPTSSCGGPLNLTAPKAPQYCIDRALLSS